MITTNLQRLRLAAAQGIGSVPADTLQLLADAARYRFLRSAESVTAYLFAGLWLEYVYADEHTNAALDASVDRALRECPPPAPLHGPDLRSLRAAAESGMNCSAADTLQLVAEASRYHFLRNCKELQQHGMATLWLERVASSQAPTAELDSLIDLAIARSAGGAQ